MTGAIALYMGIALIVAGIVLAIFAILGFRHTRRTTDVAPKAEVA